MKKRRGPGSGSKSVGCSQEKHVVGKDTDCGREGKKRWGLLGGLCSVMGRSVRKFLKSRWVGRKVSGQFVWQGGKEGVGWGWDVCGELNVSCPCCALCTEEALNLEETKRCICLSADCLPGLMTKAAASCSSAGQEGAKRRKQARAVIKKEEISKHPHRRRSSKLSEVTTDI